MNKRKDLGRLGVLVVALVLVVTLVSFASRRGDDGTHKIPVMLTPAPAMSESDSPEGQEGEAEGTLESAQEKTRATVVYYQDNYGYLVPVMRKIADQDGIAKATLSMMVQNPANDMDAARLGLRTVLPEGMKIDLDITSEGTARIDLGAQANALPDAAAESNMVSAIVQTLTEFPSVKQVNFLVDGKKVERLKNGTSVSGDFTRGHINLEGSADALPTQSSSVRLYFPGDDGALIVPITRMVFGQSDINTAVLELAKGPGGDTPLDNVLPSGCGLIDVKVENGVAKINFTREFMNIAENSDGGRQALKALVLTCTQFPGVNDVQVQVEGDDYDPGEATMATPTFINEAENVVQQFIETQSSKIFED